MRKLIVILLFFCPLCLHAQDGYSFSPDRPGMATGTSVLPSGKVIWESGIEAANQNGWVFTLPTTMLRVGVSSFAEVRLEYDGSLFKEQDKWSYCTEPIVLGAKFKIFDGKGWIPQISFMANLDIPSNSKLAKEMYVAPSLYLLFSNDITEWLNLTYNLGEEWNGIDSTPSTFLGICLSASITDSFGAFVENYNSFFKRIGETTCSFWNLDMGLTYLISPNLQIDCYGGFNLQQPSSSYLFGCGIAWLIGKSK